KRQSSLAVRRPTAARDMTASGAIHAGFRCRCPRCGKGKLFSGFLTLRPRCEVCGLDYALPIPVTARPYSSCFWLGLLLSPPRWRRRCCIGRPIGSTRRWLPLILVVALGPLRPLKGMMIALQHYHKAGERRFGAP